MNKYLLSMQIIQGIREKRILPYYTIQLEVKIV